MGTEPKRFSGFLVTFFINEFPQTVKRNPNSFHVHLKTFLIPGNCVVQFTKLGAYQ